MKNTPILIAGIICLGTAFLHLFGGQAHVDSMLASDTGRIDQSVLLGAWHMITVILFLGGYSLIKSGLNLKTEDHALMTWLGWLNILFALAFIGVSLYRGDFTPQWILFLPIGGLILFGMRKPGP